MINGTINPVLNISMIPGPDSNDSLLNFTWTCKAFTTLYMDVLMNYTYYDQVSINDVQDSIKLNFYGNKYFKANDTQTFVYSQSIITNLVPPQIDHKTGKALSILTNSLTATTKLVVVFNFILQIILSGSLQMMFSAMKKLQIIIHLLLINVFIPPNDSMFFSTLLSLVNYNIINLEKPTRRILDLNYDQPYN